MDLITSHADLLRLSDGDPWVRWALAPGDEAWYDGRTALVRRTGWRPGFWVTPLAGQDLDADRLRSALTWLADSGELERTSSVSLSVVQPHVQIAEAVFDLRAGGDWSWMWTTTASAPDPREAAIEPLDDTLDAEEISTFSHANNPRVWTEFGTGKVRTWLGVRDEHGALIAVGGAEHGPRGIPELAGIVTAAERRGEGLGAVITAGLTRRALAEHGVCTLGVFSDNTTAIDLYARLGYSIGRAWSSRLLAGGR